ncbi:gag/pol protein [Cucumis melo var. makuwa]|uniref:Gag/pol protein n=1 Tax=Cucumis melo var. makuwa TaxID=1194695 RepID=A0A5D3BK21_CUCMM|nr:gag/pol protein [Cucumis melo var. makuwa]TYJ98725.1 gag/pol protein [Cucumis melo var. makuwa]
MWKSKLNMILVIADLHFILIEEFPHFPTQNESQSVRDAYDRWTNANDKVRLYILASMPNILSKKHVIMETSSFKQLKEDEMTLKGYAVESAVYILNNVPSKSLSETHFELWRGRRPSLRLCQFFGYPKETIGGLFFDPQENRVFLSTNATFLEEYHMRDHKPRSKLILNEAIDESTKVVDEVGPSSRVDETTTSETQVFKPNDGIEDPLSYKQPMNDVDKDQWVNWVQTFKARLVAKGHRVHLSKEQCPKTPQEVEDMRRIPYASTEAA